MQRVRIGLTGLAFVFVVVLLAAVFISPSEEEPITANLIEQRMKPGARPAPSPAMTTPRPRPSRTPLRSRRRR